ncbi:Lrp/AsnC family transcriptional regulator [Paracoccus suum]|uniref:Lrp/AsnC family transcriptional regulator n=1 Tax=Paracoccus suum TaxID=2259340 RepID=A0A344PIK0_9RHOB|nr:Lrp/AsnC family transcriptional regulator [Paracoccus suum]AXC49205.1 Lrp/AsnC family transcriptional regulator [Paracoccus suum]
MSEITLDSYDRAILSALQRDGALTNAQLSELVHLSPSQCSRRRLALERAGAITGYHARLAPRALGFGIRAFTRVNLRSHGKQSDGDFATFVGSLPQVRGAHSVSGDADYVLELVVEDVDALAAFIHQHLLPHPQIAQVRSEIVLKSVKDAGGVPL